MDSGVRVARVTSLEPEVIDELLLDSRLSGIDRLSPVSLLFGLFSVIEMSAVIKGQFLSSNTTRLIK